MARRVAALLVPLLVLAGLLATAPAAAADPVERDRAGVEVLLSYHQGGGVWSTPTGEAWQPALAAEVLINSYQRTGDSRYRDTIRATFDRALGRDFFYYDDAGWYMNAWLRAYDVLGDRAYLDEAKRIFADMTTGWDGVCGGGVWWNKDRAYKNAIPNELFLLGAAKLARRDGGSAGGRSYRDWAQQGWSWFRYSGMVNGINQVNDGLTAGCANNGGTTWTYNQGVIVGALTEMYFLFGDRDYLYRAELIAEATVYGQSPGGILREPCEPSCDGDQLIFKGVFTQNLARLYDADRANKPDYYNYLTRNGDSIWDRDRGNGDRLGLSWSGPYDGGNDAARQTSGLLCVGVVALLDAGGEG